MLKVQECHFPAQSVIQEELDEASFHDSYQVISPSHNISPLEIYKAMVNNTPAWINMLLTIRNKTVNLLGLKDVGTLGKIDLKDTAQESDLIGKHLDIFTIQSISENEMIVGENDKHLDVKLSILKICEKDKTKIIVSTMLKEHNALGKVYMFFIKPFHRIILKQLLSNLAL